MIFVIDDDMVTANILEKLIKFPTMLFKSGANVVQDILKHSPELILVDNKMPDIEGSDLVAEITSEFPNQKVIVMTGNWTQELNSKCYRNGAMFCLWKNGRINTIASQINTYVKDVGITITSKAS